MAKNARHSELVLESQNIEAPYEMPEEWKWCRLGDVVEVLNGYPFKSEKYVNQGIRVIRITNVQDGYIEDLKPCFYPEGYSNELSQYTLCENDLLISLTGNVGRVALLPKEYLPAALNQRVGCLREKSNQISKKYIAYYLRQHKFLSDCIKSSKGTAQLNMSTEWLKRYPIPLPPTLAEQERIVNRIETIFAKLDQAQEKVQTVLDSFENCKAAILHKAFTGQLKIENEELTIEDWEEKSFSDLGTSNLGKMLDANKNTGDEIRYLRNINVRWFDFDLSDLLTMRAKPEEIKKLSVKKGDLFICEGGEPGRCAVWKDENADLIFQKAIHRFRPNDGVSSEFVAYVLYYYNQIGKLSDYFTGTTIKHLTGQSLAKIPIRIPSLNYQLSIVNFLDTVVEKESRAKEAAKTVLGQIALLKKSILARAFRGKI